MIHKSRRCWDSGNLYVILLDACMRWGFLKQVSKIQPLLGEEWPIIPGNGAQYPSGRGALPCGLDNGPTAFIVIKKIIKKKKKNM